MNYNFFFRHKRIFGKMPVIYVLTPSNSIISIELDFKLKINNLVLEIGERINVESFSIQLLYENKILNLGKSLVDYGIHFYI